MLTETFYCDLCHFDCATYDGPAATDCLTCPSGQFFTQNGATKTCGACASGSFGAASGFCESCPANCSTCSDSSTCTACAANFFLLFGICGTSCPAQGYFQSGGVCSECDNTCRTCSGAASTQCTSCYSQDKVSGWQFVALHQNQCLTGCPLATFLENGACQAGCPSGQYSFNNNCLPCPTDLTGLTTQDQIAAVTGACGLSPASGSIDPSTLETSNASYVAVITASIISADVDNVFVSQTLVNSAFVRMLASSGPLSTSTANIVYWKQEVSTVATAQQSLASGLSRGAAVSLTPPSASSTGINSGHCVIVAVFPQNLYTAQPEFVANNNTDSPNSCRPL